MNTTEKTTVNIAIDGMSCGTCVAGVTRALQGVPGVEVKRVDIGSASVVVAGLEGAKAAVAAINDAGFEARPSPAAAPAKRGGSCGCGPSCCG